MSDALTRCFSEAQMNGLTLKNRLLKAATFEGKCPGGVPSKELEDFHVRIARGGVAMTTLGYCAPEPDGQMHPNMLCMDERIAEPLGGLIRSVQSAGARVAGQLTHCGVFTKNHALSTPRPLGPSFGLNRLGVAEGIVFGSAMTHEQIRERVQAFARAATFMKSVGFDAIEIHFGHGYGLSQFISPKTNRRKDEYGGSLTNRMRLPLEVLAAVREAVGDSFPLLGRISMSDGVSGGINYEDSVEIAALLDAGGIDVIICSGGTSSMNPMLLFRGDSMAPGLIAAEQNPLMKLGMRLIDPFFFKKYPYEPLYFLEHSRKIRERVKCGVGYVGGACSNDDLRTLMEDGFDFVHLGRGLLFDPDFAKHAAADPAYVNGCIHCNECATLIDVEGGIRCTQTPPWT